MSQLIVVKEDILQDRFVLKYIVRQIIQQVVGQVYAAISTNVSHGKEIKLYCVCI